MKVNRRRLLTLGLTWTAMGFMLSAACGKSPVAYFLVFSGAIAWGLWAVTE